MLPSLTPRQNGVTKSQTNHLIRVLTEMTRSILIQTEGAVSMTSRPPKYIYWRKFWARQMKMTKDGRDTKRNICRHSTKSYVLRVKNVKMSKLLLISFLLIKETMTRHWKKVSQAWDGKKFPLFWFLNHDKTFSANFGHKNEPKNNC